MASGRDGASLLAGSRLLRMVVEPGLPVRYYLPRPGVRIDPIRFRVRRTICSDHADGSGLRYRKVAGGEEDGAPTRCHERPCPEMATTARGITFPGERVKPIEEHARQEHPGTACTASSRR